MKITHSGLMRSARGRRGRVLDFSLCGVRKRWRRDGGSGQVTWGVTLFQLKGRELSIRGINTRIKMRLEYLKQSCIIVLQYEHRWTSIGSRHPLGGGGWKPHKGEEARGHVEGS